MYIIIIFNWTIVCTKRCNFNNKELRMYSNIFEIKIFIPNYVCFFFFLPLIYIIAYVQASTFK